MNLDYFADSIWHQLDITEKTRSDYILSYQKNISPKLGHIEISDLTKKEIIETISTLRSQTAYKALMVLKTLFREAAKRELIYENPSTGIPSPRIRVKPQKFLTWEELSEIDFGFHTKRIRFLALHGLRYGEAAALTNGDILDGRVHITKSKYGPTKTKSGVRSVPLMSEFVEFPMYQDRIAKALKPHGVTVHSLRKTYAYLLKQSNVHVTTAAKLLGHSNPLVTMKIYTLVLDSEIEKTGQALSAFMSAF